MKILNFYWKQINKIKKVNLLKMVCKKLTKAKQLKDIGDEENTNYLLKKKEKLWSKPYTIKGGTIKVTKFFGEMDNIAMSVQKMNHKIFAKSDENKN